MESFKLCVIFEITFLSVVFSPQSSGDEGFYPHLIKFCEAHLEKLDPRSAALRRENLVTTATSLQEDERCQIMDDLMVC